jgi:hypothetical protein
VRRRGLCVFLAAALLCAAPASAAPGMVDDPVVTRRYLEDVFLPSVRIKAADASNQAFDGVSARVRELLKFEGSGLPLNEKALTRKVISRLNLLAPLPGVVTLKAGSALTLGQGTSVQLFSGSAAHGGGVLVDATAGRDVTAKAALEARHRYVSLGADTTVNVTSGAVVLIHGTYRFTPPYEPMYKDLCDALVTMHVINTYELERDTTRMEMFVIFVSILGVKRDAYSYTGSHPFTDVPEWGDPYVAYLYANNHTAGTGNNKFSPGDSGSVQQMCFIMLKALGYQDRTDISYETAVADAVRLGLFSRRETEILRSEGFTRDVMMYMTYYSLFARYKDSGELVLDRLIANGQVREDYAAEALASVKRKRF